MSLKLIPYTLVFATMLGLSCATSQPVQTAKCFDPPSRSPGDNFLGAEAFRMTEGMKFTLDVVSQGDDKFTPLEQHRARMVRVAMIEALAQLLRDKYDDEDKQIIDNIAHDVFTSTKDNARRLEVEESQPLPTP